MTAVLSLGGPLAIDCPLCEERRGDVCRTVGKGSRTTATLFAPTKTHAARVKAAPPAEEARAGDLVMADVSGKTLLAQLLEVGAAAVRARLWRATAQAFAPARMLPRSAVLRLAPEDAAVTKLARAELDIETRSEGTIAAFRKAVE